MYKKIVLISIISVFTISAMEQTAISSWQSLKQRYKVMVKESRDNAEKGPSEKCYLTYVPQPILKEIGLLCLINDLKDSVERKKENFYIRNNCLYKINSNKTSLFSSLSSDKKLFTGRPKQWFGSYWIPHVIDFSINGNNIAIVEKEYGIDRDEDTANYNVFFGKIGHVVAAYQERMSIYEFPKNSTILSDFVIKRFSLLSDGETIASLEKLNNNSAIVYRKRNGYEFKIPYADFDNVKYMKIFERYRLLALLKHDNGVQLIPLPDQIKFTQSNQSKSEFDAMLEAKGVCHSLESS